MKPRRLKKYFCKAAIIGLVSGLVSLGYGEFGPTLMGDHFVEILWVIRLGTAAVIAYTLWPLCIECRNGSILDYDE